MLHQDYISSFLTWQKRFAMQQRNFLRILIVTLCAALVICEFGMILFHNNNDERTIAHNMHFVQYSALQEARSIERKLNETVGMIDKLAAQYAYLERHYPEMTVGERIQILWDGTVFDHVTYVTREGNDFFLQGGANLSDRDYFQRAMSGSSGYQLLEESRQTREPALIYYAPIYQKNEITGVMLGFYERERIEHLISYQFLNNAPQIYLLRGDGFIASAANGMYHSGNMLDTIASMTYHGSTDYEAIRETIDDDSRQSIAFTFMEEGSRTLGVVAQFSSSDMMILSVLPSEITDMMISEADQAGWRLLMMVSIAFIILLTVFSVFIVRQQRRIKEDMSKAIKKLIETHSHDRKQSMIVEALSNTYTSVYHAELKNNRYERIAEGNPGVAEKIAASGDLDTACQTYLNHLINPDDRERMEVFLNHKDCIEKLEKGKKLGLEYRREDQAWCKAIIIPALRDDAGAITSVIFAVQSIDEDKRRELDTKKALEEACKAATLASNAKTTFLSNISHDIRTPMNAIVGMTAIAGANLSNHEKVADCLRKISMTSGHLLGIINEVLDMSKIETGRIDLNEEDFNLPDLFEELIAINQPLIKEKNHTLSVRINELEHENVTGDRVRLQQVFTNLLTNAIKYTPAGGKLKISLTEKNYKSNVGWYEVVFRDNGIGMSEEFQAHMFEPFSRARDSRIVGIAGTGLGMPIARNIIRMMNGDIKVDSQINEGSTITVSFALRIQHREAADDTSLKHLPVLVVDASAGSCKSLCSMLSSLSMRSEYVTSCHEAIEKILMHHELDEDYYAVLIDWHMPEMNGIETAREIRRQMGDSTPFIILAAYEWMELEKEARAAGVSALLSKPVFKSRLIHLFQKLTVQPEASERTASEGTASENQLQEQDFAGKHILLAEDNELNREIATEILSMMGLDIDTAENGRVCLEKFASSQPGRYDLIFMDIQMPEMDGYQAASAIRVSGHPQAKTIPIIAMSANAFSSDVQNAIHAGMNGHIAKPIDIGRLVRVIREFVK